MKITEIEKKPRAIVLCGLPGTGKSTLLKKFIPELGNDLFIYSTDNYIDTQAAKNNTNYDKIFSDEIKTATSVMNSTLDSAIQNNSNILWDQTNISSKKRRIILRKIPDNYHRECHCIVPPSNANHRIEWDIRLNSRTGKTIPQDILHSMESNFEIPAYTEGWDTVVLYDIYGNILDQ